jgi:hypothetical protein
MFFDTRVVHTKGEHEQIPADGAATANTKSYIYIYIYISLWVAIMRSVKRRELPSVTESTIITAVCIVSAFVL